MKKINKKILILSPYPIRNPQHGGQKRVRAIYDHYNEVFEEVRFVAIFHRAFYEYDESQDILIGDQEIIKKLDENPELTEVLSGLSLVEDPHVKNQISQVLDEFRPDIVQIEQPFLYAGLRKLLGELGQRPKIIYSSQNIEYMLKSGAAEAAGSREKSMERAIALVKEVELRITKEADLSIAVSEQDKDELLTLGANNVALAPNGISKNSPNKKTVEYWRRYIKKSNFKEVVLFVGSGHPPNAIGLVDTVGKDLAFLPEGAKLLVAGGASEFLKHKMKLPESFWTHTLPLGVLDEEKLNALISVADVIILPITQGGGSNLKTAEAILADKKIVATSFSFRAFEKYINLPNVYIADSPKAFQAAIIKALKSSKIKRTSQEQSMAQQVQWKFALAPLNHALRIVSRDSLVFFLRKKLAKFREYARNL